MQVVQNLAGDVHASFGVSDFDPFTVHKHDGKVRQRNVGLAFGTEEPVVDPPRDQHCLQARHNTNRPSPSRLVNPLFRAWPIRASWICALASSSVAARPLVLMPAWRAPMIVIDRDQRSPGGVSSAQSRMRPISRPPSVTT
jgi:hypothetical protein